MHAEGASHLPEVASDTSAALATDLVYDVAASFPYNGRKKLIFFEMFPVLVRLYP